MKIKEELKNLRGLDADKLAKELSETRKKVYEDTLKVKAGKLDNFSLVSKNRKLAARISTLINEKMDK
jgi:ribosomal protein L29